MNECDNGGIGMKQYGLVQDRRCWLPVGGVGRVHVARGELQHVLGGPDTGVRVGLDVQQLGGQTVVRGVGRGGDVDLQLG